MTKNESSGATQGDWAKLANYRSGFEADMACATLEGADILVQLRGQQIGIYGLGFQGPVPGGPVPG